MAGIIASYEQISEMFAANPDIQRLLVKNQTLETVREELNEYLNRCEMNILRADCPLHPLEQKNTRDCIRVFRNLISESSEFKTGCSCLSTLWDMAQGTLMDKDVSESFIQEMVHLFKGVLGLSGIYSESGICSSEVPDFMVLEGRAAAQARSTHLDQKADKYKTYTYKNRYTSGLEQEVEGRRKESRDRILRYLKATENDWNDYRWQLRHRFQRIEDICEIISLSEEEKKHIEITTRHRLPFGITPYYLSLMDRASEMGLDRSLRAQVIPNHSYLDTMLKSCCEDQAASDFMHEGDTSPEEFITRRYASIAIIKPYLWCPQICVYCQRNWELTNEEEIRLHPTLSNLENAFAWFRDNPAVTEVLITGGDPLTLSNDMLDYVIGQFNEMKHITRIRIGTRTLVTMPMRFNEGLLNIFQKYHRPPYKTLILMTHFQHAYEISNETADIMKLIKKQGIDVYNQQVFTMYNSRRFETCFLRENLKSIGITPYYLFNLKGKEETKDFKVPIARLLQEQKEEARLLPGTVRTDKAVFNVPTLGKNDLNAWQDHDIIMIDRNGSRIYEFYPWEKYSVPVNTFLFRDEPIGAYLSRLEAMGEDIADYQTIWYYF
ncbi:Glutamate 2,3-aminomutase [compost metagenome]